MVPSNKIVKLNWFIELSQCSKGETLTLDSLSLSLDEVIRPRGSENARFPSLNFIAYTVVSAISRRERSSSRSRVSSRRELEIQTSELPPLLLQMTRQSIRLWPHREWDRENKKRLVLPPCLSLPPPSSVLSLPLSFFLSSSIPSTNASGCSASTLSCRGWNSVNPSVASNYHEKRKHLRQRDFGGLSDSFRTTCAPEKLDETSPSTLSSSPSVPDGRRRIPFTRLQRKHDDGWKKVGKRWMRIELVYYAPSVNQRQNGE